VEQIKLQKIDEGFLSEHSCLVPVDCCYFIGEYASKQGFGNLPEWPYKGEAILKIASWLMSTTVWQNLKSATWVPIPPSKIKSDPQYDNRLWQVLLKMKEKESSLDIRELLLAQSSRKAAHNPGEIRPNINNHLNNFILDSSQKDPQPRGIILFDDIITSGASFKAAQRMIQQEFQNIKIIGLFVARAAQIR
jgi:predicted amidophosphoribosyltransferase